MPVTDAIAAVCLVLGAALSLTAAIGLVRFPDLLSRLHTATKPQVLGLLLILVAVALRIDEPLDIGIVVVIGILQLVTSPVAAHMVGRAAYRTGQVRSDLLATDELDHAYRHK